VSIILPRSAMELWPLPVKLSELPATHGPAGGARFI